MTPMLPKSLDPASPEEWRDVRAALHELLDACLDDVRSVERPESRVWSAPSFAPRLASSDTATGVGIMQTMNELRELLSQDSGNRSPKFFGYAQGAGNLASLAADVVCSAQNSNCGGRVHAAISVERDVIAWSARLFGLPPTTSGVLTTGTSEAHLIAARVIRYDRSPDRSTVVMSTEAHSSVAQAFDSCGFGSCSRLLYDPEDP